MADNTIQAVRQAETEAAQIEREAALKKQEQIDDVQTDIVARREALYVQLNNQKDAELDAAVKTNEALMQKTVTGAKEEIQALRNEVETKKKQVVTKIIEELL